MGDANSNPRSLWSRLLADESLSDAERQKLRDALSGDARLQQELRSDATVHAMLLSLQDIDDTQESFIAGVMSVCQPAALHEQSDTSCADSGEDAGDVLPNFSEPCRPPQAGVSPGSSASAANVRRDGRRWKIRGASWKTVTMTLSVLAGIGLVVWSQIEHSGTVARNESDRSREQDQRPPDDRERHGPALASDDPSGPIPPESDPADAQQSDGRPQPPKFVGPPETGFGFVTLTRIDDPVWEQERQPGDRLSDEVVRLFGGSVELTFDYGAVVILEAPVEFRPVSDASLWLRQGRVSANVPSSARGFKVSTPTSEVVDLGTEFEVTVKNSGETTVVVQKGVVEVSPSVLPDDVGKTWRLVADGLDCASFYARPDSSPTSPISAFARGTDDQFEGFICVGGREADFASQETFETVHQHVMSSFSASGSEIFRLWNEFVDSLPNTQIRGFYRISGITVPVNSLQDTMELRTTLQGRGVKFDANAGADAPFAGAMSINDTLHVFRTRAEYEAARHAAFGAAATFGAGALFKTNTP